MLLPYIVVALFGLVLGSFLNVCIVRLPKHESIVTPRSHCPRCDRPIHPYHNIPVVSYLFLRGRCRYCGENISPVYPLVEILTAGLLVITFAKYELSPEFVKYALLLMLLLIIIFTDLKERRVPHAVTIFGMGVGLLMSLVITVDSRPVGWLLAFLGLYPAGVISSLLGSVAGALVGGGLFYAVGEAFYYLSGLRGEKKEYLGFGDVMLMLMVGTFLGPPLTLLTVLLGSLGGTIVAVPLTLAGPRFHDYEWPYGTFLGVAAIFCGLEGQNVLNWYLNWAGLN